MHHKPVCVGMQAEMCVHLHIYMYLHSYRVTPIQCCVSGPKAPQHSERETREDGVVCKKTLQKTPIFLVLPPDV